MCEIYSWTQKRDDVWGMIRKEKLVIFNGLQSWQLGNEEKEERDGAGITMRS
jgi:hypothetical protein